MEDTRSFSGYIARLIALIAGVILIILAIWFVVQLFQDGNKEVGVVVTDDETTGSYSVVENLLGDTSVTVAENQAGQVAATQTEVATAANKTTPTQALPDTGPGATFMSALGIGVLMVALYRYSGSRRALNRLV